MWNRVWAVCAFEVGFVLIYLCTIIKEAILLMEITLKYFPGINRYGAMSVMQGVFKRVRAYVWHLSFYIMRNRSLYPLRHVSDWDWIQWISLYIRAFTTNIHFVIIKFTVYLTSRKLCAIHYVTKYTWLTYTKISHLTYSSQSLNTCIKKSSKYN